MSPRIFSLLLAFSPFFLLAQNTLNIHGQVIDNQENTPIPFASIITGGEGAITDEDGTYHLTITDSGDKLTVTCSFLGFETQTKTIQANGQSDITLNFSLSESNKLLETAVVTAGRFEKSLSKTTVSLSVIKPQLLENNNIISVDDALNQTSGVDVIDGQANIRGGSGYSYGAGSRVLLLLDGMPIMQTDAAFPNWADMPIENVGQIEILKGASSALYGSSAMNGIVNIRTAVPTEKTYLHVAPFYTMYFSPKDQSQKWWDKSPYAAGVSAVLRKRIKQFGITVGGFYLSEEGYKKDTYKKYGRGFIGLNYYFSEKIEAGIRAYYNPGATATFFYWNDDTTGIYTPAPNTLSETKRTRFNIDPYIQLRDGNDNVHRLQGRYLSANNKNSNDNAVTSSMTFVEYQFLRHFKAIGLTLTTGLAYTGSAISAELYGDTTYAAQNSAAYLQLEKTIGRLTISGGVRYEKNVLHSPEIISSTVFGMTTYDTIPNGLTEESKPVFRLGLNWHLAKATYIRASFGQGYRYPTIAEKFISTTIGAGVPILPNATLDSESGISYEVGVKQGVMLGQLKGFIDLSLFSSTYRDMMEFVFGGRDGTTLGFTSLNVGNTQIWGGELSLAGKIKLGPTTNRFMGGVMQISPKYTDFSDKIKTSSSSDKNILKYRFKNSWKLDWETQYKKMALGISVIHNGPTEAVDDILEEIITGAKHFREEHNGFTVMDLRTSYRLTPHYKLALIGQNIFNLTYSQRIGRLEQPFNLSLRFDYDF